MGSNAKFTDYDDIVQMKLDLAMPWIGLYIAAASTVCTLAMAADVINGFRLNKLWFPSRFFSLNAASLTALAVATKLPVDLNTNMLNPTDTFAKYTSLVFLLTALANFMTSLGSMTNADILANVTALVIFVVTVAVNVAVQLIELHEFLEKCIVISMMLSTVFMLMLLTALVSLSVAVINVKKSLELRYQEKHRVALRETLKRRISSDDQRVEMMKYLVMAETSSPQFVMARSVVCSSFSSTFLFASILHAVIILVGAYIIEGYPQKNEPGESPYGVYTSWILYVQMLGVVVGAVAPAFRLLVAVKFKCSDASLFGMDSFKIEDYWIGSLVEWRDSFSGLELIQHDLCRKYLHDAKWFALSLFIGVQILVVLLSKLLLLLFALLMSPLFSLVAYLKEPGHDDDDDDDDETNRGLSSYVLRLEGEVELPRSVLKNIRSQADQLIHKGRRMQPMSLLNLLHKSSSFNGVGEFDSDEIPSLHSQEPPNCWTLPVVTLTSIAIALPCVAKHKVEQLLSGVREGLSLAKIVEETAAKKDNQLANIIKATDICWAGVVLYKKWLGINLNKLTKEVDQESAIECGLKCKNSMKVLKELTAKAQMMITKIKKDEQDELIMQNPLNWPPKLVASNSMFRISRTIYYSCEDHGKDQTDEEVFDRLCVMIADILAACFTNIPRVVTTMCHISAIERREESVRAAFLLLGKTEQVVQLVQKRKWPSLEHDKAGCIDEWRALFRQQNCSPTTPGSIASGGTHSASVSQEHLGITILR